MSALALRAYQSFGIDNTALLAVGLALLAFGESPHRRMVRFAHRATVHFWKDNRAFIAGLLVLFVATANLLPSLLGNGDAKEHPSSGMMPRPKVIPSAAVPKFLQSYYLSVVSRHIYLMMLCFLKETLP